MEEAPPQGDIGHGRSWLRPLQTAPCGVEPQELEELLGRHSKGFTEAEVQGPLGRSDRAANIYDGHRLVHVEHHVLASPMGDLPTLADSRLAARPGDVP